jgi:hypothetical protein
MTPTTLCLWVTVTLGIEGAIPEHLQKYLRRCDEIKTARISAKSREIKALETSARGRTDFARRLEESREELKRLIAEPAPLAPLPLPVEKGTVGVFASGDRRLGRAVDVLEVVDEDDVIVRAWYWVTSPLPPDPTPAEDATFVDLWIHGIDTNQLQDRLPSPEQVFHVTGNKVFDTACGKRSLPLLEPLDIAPYRGSQNKEPPGGAKKQSS